MQERFRKGFLKKYVQRYNIPYLCKEYVQIWQEDDKFPLHRKAPGALAVNKEDRFYCTEYFHKKSVSCNSTF